MTEESSFNLSQFLTDSLVLHGNGGSQTKAMYHNKLKDPYLGLTLQDPLEVLGEKSFGQPRLVSEDTLGTPVQEFFRGANVFITGGTGFIGKVLIEKLIRSVPHIGHIYILIRSKRGKTSKERFHQLFEDQVFTRMKKEVPHYQTKVTGIDGDISEPELGLKPKDYQMLTERINVIYHSAADVRFVEPLKVAIASNVIGSKRVMDLAKEMINLQSYVYVSTAFSQCVQKVIKENVPKMPIDYREVLRIVESSNAKELELEIPRIMQGWPNTYTFSKAICEDMIQEEGKDLPICIFRPSVVGPTYKEPVRGWTDNLYGPSGMLLGAGLGILHCFPMDVEVNLDIVPVDYVTNCMIAVAWKTGTYRDPDVVPVYNFTATSVRPILWKTIVNSGLCYKNYFPYGQAIWYTAFFPTKSLLLDQIAHRFLHTVPGKVIDLLIQLAGQKPRLSKIYDRIQTLKGPLYYFSSNVWHFENDNVMELLRSLSLEDQREFHFDVRDLDIIEYLLLGKLGLRYYYLKEKMETLPAAVRKTEWLKMAHQSLLLVTGVCLLKVAVTLANVLPI